MCFRPPLFWSRKALWTQQGSPKPHACSRFPTIEKPHYLMMIAFRNLRTNNCGSVISIDSLSKAKGVVILWQVDVILVCHQKMKRKGPFFVFCSLPWGLWYLLCVRGAAVVSSSNRMMMITLGSTVEGQGGASLVPFNGDAYAESRDLGRRWWLHWFFVFSMIRHW